MISCSGNVRVVLKSVVTILNMADCVQNFMTVYNSKIKSLLFQHVSGVGNTFL